jgi:hypothetical protein
MSNRLVVFVQANTSRRARPSIHQTAFEVIRETNLNKAQSNRQDVSYTTQGGLGKSVSKKTSTVLNFSQHSKHSPYNNISA